MADTIRFNPPAYPGGRIPLMSGQITVGAVFPPVGDGHPKPHWHWRLWFGGETRNGHAKTEDAAKGHLVAAFALTLLQAGMQPIPN